LKHYAISSRDLDVSCKLALGGESVSEDRHRSLAASERVAIQRGETRRAFLNTGNTRARDHYRSIEYSGGKPGARSNAILSSIDGKAIPLGENAISGYRLCFRRRAFHHR
jgi:hypothetical protein